MQSSVAQRWWHEAHTPTQKLKDTARFTLECSTRIPPELFAHYWEGQESAKSWELYVCLCFVRMAMDITQHGVMYGGAPALEQGRTPMQFSNPHPRWDSFRKQDLPPLGTSSQVKKPIKTPHAPTRPVKGEGT